MSPTFSFPPPPPPPPPKRDNPAIAPSQHGGFRGRGRGRGHTGGFHSRGSGQSFRGRPYQRSPMIANGTPYLGSQDLAGSPKRNHAQAFGQQPQSRPKAPPAVPDFNVDTKSLLQKKPVIEDDKPAKKKVNALGLTPKNQDDPSDSEDDIDDELNLAQNSTAEGLRFEHRGKTLSLNSREDIAAWIAERRRKYPTHAKVEAAKREAEERKKLWEAQKAARAEAAIKKREARENERKEQERRKLKEKLIAMQVAKAKSVVATSKEDTALRAKEKAEKLRRKADKAMRDLHKAEEAVAKSTQSDVAAPLDSDQHVIASSTDSDSDSDDTSSSGSSAIDSDNGSEPEEATSKRQAPDRVAPPKQRTQQNDRDGATFCKNLLNYGRCRYGWKCRFSHEREDKPRPRSSGNRHRKGLWDMFLEGEKDEQMRQAVYTILDLGESGLLADPEQKDNSAAT